MHLLKITDEEIRDLAERIAYEQPTESEIRLALALRDAINTRIEDITVKILETREPRYWGRPESWLITYGAGDTPMEVSVTYLGYDPHRDPPTVYSFPVRDLWATDPVANERERLRAYALATAELQRVRREAAAAHNQQRIAENEQARLLKLRQQMGA